MVSKEKSISKTISLVWSPPCYPVVWANIPDEVPAFDVTRGGNPFEVALEESIHTHLGGNLPPETGEQAYPRLVREHPFQYARPPLDKDERVSEAIAALNECLEDDERLRREVKRLVNRSSVLDPFSLYRDTLEGWKMSIKEIRFCFELLREDKNARKGGVSYSQHMTDWLSPREDRDALQLKEWIDAFSGYLAENFGKPNKVITVQEKGGTMVSLIRSKEKIRDALAEYLWRRFVATTVWGKEAREAALVPALWPISGSFMPTAVPGQLMARCGALGWAYHELWQTFIDGKGVEICKGCGGLFIPQRKKKESCSGNECRIKRSRKRKEDALRLHKEGVSAHAIAAEVGSKLETVKRWLKAAQA